MLKVSGVGKHYPSPRGPLTVLSDVSFALSAGDAAAITGPSGSGKSSLLYMLGALEPPSQGTITLDGQNPFDLAASALGLGNAKIMFRHMLPNAMVATLTLLPFIITGAIGGLAALDFLGLGLPPSYPSLGELALQGKNRLNAPWLGFTAFFTFATMLSLLVFIFEGVRDAFDPRKTFR